jgi:hypothetical protein
VKGYRLIDLSSDLLIIERSVQFKESVSHAPQQPHGDTFILPPVRDDEHAHANSSSDESSDSEESDDSYSESVQSDVESEHPDAVAEPEQRPKWAQTTLQDAGDLVGDPANIRRTRSDFKEPPIALTTTEPLPSRHIFLVQSSYPQSYGEAAGNPFWESAMQEEYNSLFENQTWDLVPLPSGRKLVRCRWVYRTKSAADGQINFVRCKSDPNVYILRTADSLLLLVLHVDDLLITSCSTSAIAAVKRILHDRFFMTDMGPLHFFLELEIS